jgi:hypothetical protein
VDIHGLDSGGDHCGSAVAPAFIAHGALQAPRGNTSKIHNSCPNILKWLIFRTIHILSCCVPTIMCFLFGVEAAPEALNAYPGCNGI